MSRRSLTLLAAVAAACTFASGAGAAGRTCGWSGYSYAGYQSAEVAYGVSGRLTLRSEPVVESGHVAAWIGVGGEGLGPGGSTEWLQVGVAGFPDGHSELYYEYRLPADEAPVYVSLGRIRPGASRKVAVVERPRRPNSWRVLVDGKPRGETIRLPGSHGAWKPIATAEAWDGGARVCNRFAYDFSDLALAARHAGGWAPFALANPITAPGYRLLARASGFTARAT